MDVSKNSITTIDGLSSSSLKETLETLIIKDNKLSDIDSIKNIKYIEHLHELDLSKNKIDCSPETLTDLLIRCRHLTLLSLKGNPVAKHKHYRHWILSRCSSGLTHLDGKPICKEERRRCRSWRKHVKSGVDHDAADEMTIFW